MQRLAVLGLLVAAAGSCSRSEEPTPPPGSATLPSTPTTMTTTLPPPATNVDPWAPAPQRALPAPTPSNPLRRPMFWAAEKDGRTTYLLGTLHGGIDAEQRLPLWVWDRFHAATTLVLETNLQDPRVAEWTVRPAGPTLREELGEPYWGALEGVVSAPIAMLLERQATALAALRVSGYGAGGDPSTPMDGNLLVRAQGLAKQIVFLEDQATQRRVLTKHMNLTALKLLLDRRDELTKLNRAFFDAYKAGDEAALFATARRSFALQTPDDVALNHLLEGLLLERNAAWIPALERVHATGGAFVAVGALHLAGERSVLELLRGRGFRVERVEAPLP